MADPGTSKKSLGKKMASPATREDFPKILYKYYPVDDHSLRVISENEIFFSNPLIHFNDPFDCRLELDFRGSLDKWKRKIRTWVKRRNEKLTKKELQRMALEKLKESKDPAGMTKFHEGLIEEAGMFCLSGSKENILMYSHYSKSHTGFCLGFFFSSLARSLKFDSSEMIKKIEYIKELDRPSYFSASAEEIAFWIFFTKSENWRYEDEWRIVSRGHWGPRVIGDNVIGEIILGCQISEENEEKIRRLNENRKTPARIFRAVKKRKEIGLDREEVV